MSGTAELAGTAELERIYSAIEESAALMDVACSRDKVWPVLTAFADALSESVIAFRVATDSRHKGEFDGRFTLPQDLDPYVRALSKGLITQTGHPIDTLLSDIQERCPNIDSYGVNFGVVGGFAKVWLYFPEGGFQQLSKLVDMPSMPPSLAGNVSFFARYGLAENVDVIGIDYDRRTVNVYSPAFELPDGCLEPKSLISMHRELGLPDPSEQMLKLCAQSFGVYATLGWDSPKVERISFGVSTLDPLALPARLGPKIEQFVKSVPYGKDDPKKVYVAMTSTGEEYYKLQSYYRWLPRKPSVRRQA